MGRIEDEIRGILEELDFGGERERHSLTDAQQTLATQALGALFWRLFNGHFQYAINHGMDQGSANYWASGMEALIGMFAVVLYPEECADMIRLLTETDGEIPENLDKHARMVVRSMTEAINKRFLAPPEE